MAKYIRGAACDQPMLLPPSVDDYVSEGSPLRALDAFVDSLDLACLGFGARKDGSAGRSSYDPSSLTKLGLFGRELVAIDGTKSRNRRSDHLCRGIELAGAEMRLGFWACNFTQAVNVLGSGGLIAAIQTVAEKRKARLSTT